MSGWVEKARRAWQQDSWKKNGERFGIGLAAAMAVMSAVAMYRGHMARVEVLQVCSVVLLSLALVAPRLLYPAAWLLETAFKTVTKTLMYVLLVLVFYLVFAPVGIALRILGKDPMQRKIDPAAESYWSERKPLDPKRTERQF